MYLKIVKKKWKKKNDFFIFLFLCLFSKLLKVRLLGKKTSGFWTVQISKICQTFGPDVMSGRALNFLACFCHFWQLLGKVIVSRAAMVDFWQASSHSREHFRQVFIPLLSRYYILLTLTAFIVTDTHITVLLPSYFYLLANSDIPLVFIIDLFAKEN